MKKILIINGHPDKESYCFHLAEAYLKGAKSARSDCKLIHVIDLKFNPILQFGYRKISPLEPDLVMMQKEILDAQHLVFVYPNWWGTYPAMLKGFFDRIFLPHFAFKYRPDSPFWDRLLTDKSARLIVTMDTPKWYYFWVYRSPGHNSMKRCILNFSGIKPIAITSFGPIKSSSLEKRKKWLDEVESLGKHQH